MTLLLKTEEVRQQSLGVWAQFGESLWKPNAETNNKVKDNTKKETDKTR